MIEAHQVEDFKTFVRALCFWAPPNGLCLTFPSRCRKCLQENEVTIVDANMALEFGQTPLRVEGFLTKSEVNENE